jgi:predicted Zn-dependent protease
MADYLNLVRDVVAKVAARGVEGEAIIIDSQETQIDYATGAVEKLSQSGSKGLGVRVIDEGRVGYAYTSDFTPARIETTWQKAVELAAVASEDHPRRRPGDLRSGLCSGQHGSQNRPPAPRRKGRARLRQPDRICTRGGIR